MRLLRAFGVAVTVAIWAMATVWLDASVIGQSLTTSDDGRGDITSCQDPRDDLEFGYSTWSWLRLGKVCHFEDGRTTEASWARLPGFVILNGGLFAGTVFMVVRIRRSSLHRVDDEDLGGERDDSGFEDDEVSAEEADDDDLEDDEVGAEEADDDETEDDT